MRSDKTRQKAIDSILADLDSLSIERSLTEQSYINIVNAGFRGNNGTLAAIIAQELVRENPITLRGLFYRVVSTGFLDSTSKVHYDRVGRLVTRLRRKKTISYEWIVDSLRTTDKPSSWSGLQDFADTVREAYRKSFWDSIAHYVHVFTEKDAIAGVIQPVTREYDVRLSPVRGYCSESFAWGIADQWRRIEKPIFAAYLGDYDPSGFDIERDLVSKLRSMSGKNFEWVRLGVNQDDFEMHDLVKLKPKKTDSRFRKFQAIHGDHCAEIDAISPGVLRDRVRDFIEAHIPQGEWERLKQVEALERETFATVLDNLQINNDEDEDV